MNINPSLLTAAGRAAASQQVAETGNAVAAHVGGDWSEHRQVQVHAVAYQDQAGHTVSNHTLRVLATHDSAPEPVDVVLALPIQFTAETAGAPGVAPILVQQPGMATVVAGTVVVFEVLAVSATPVTYQWYRLVNTLGVYNDEPVPGAVHRMLVLDAVLPEDAGSYRCVVTNTHGATASAYGTLTVTEVSDA